MTQHPGGDERESDEEARGQQAPGEARDEQPPEPGAPDRAPDREADREARHGERDRLRDALVARRDRLARRRAALGRQLAAGTPADEMRAAASLLLARQREIPRGADSVRLMDFGGGEREITLDPALGPIQNAERLFGEARRRERAESFLPREMARVAKRLRRLDHALTGLEESGPTDELWALAGGRPDDDGEGPSAGAARRGDGPATALPYRRLRSSGGLEIRVGRSAAGNDELTFHHSAPEDIWLHARQVPGAHVILRWGRRETSPPHRDLIEAAIAAALGSEARHSGTVGVDWTRRKYVRKPRKAPPGVVVPERVKTLFVEPDEAVLERLKETD